MALQLICSNNYKRIILLEMKGGGKHSIFYHAHRNDLDVMPFHDRWHIQHPDFSLQMPGATEEHGILRVTANSVCEKSF